MQYTANKPLNFAGTFNVRELGGYVNADGVRLRTPKILRGDDLSNLTEEGMKALQEYGVKICIDLRIYEEKQKLDPFYMSNELEFHSIPISAYDGVQECGILIESQEGAKEGARRDGKSCAQDGRAGGTGTKLPGQMSGGQRQRVALARAIVKQPEVFLMDEPLSNLDAKLRNQMRHSILELHKKLGTTFVYVTHDQTEAMTMGDNIVLLNEGKIIQQGSPKEMYTNPNHIFVAGFIGNPSTNLIEMPFGYIGIRPEDLHTRNRNAEDIELTGTVNASEPMGSDILYDITTKVGRFHVKADNKWEDESKNLVVHVPKDKVLYFDKEGNRIYDAHIEEGVFLTLLKNHL